MKSSSLGSAASEYFTLVLEAARDWWVGAGFWRWVGRLAGIALVGVWVRMVWFKELGEDGPLGAIGSGLVAFACLIAGAVLLAPSLVPWIASPLLRLADSIYLGRADHGGEPPSLTYEVAERRVRERRWQDAAAEYERIAYWHPREERAWREAIRCSELAGDLEGAEWLWRRARRRGLGLPRPGAGPDSTGV